MTSSCLGSYLLSGAATAIGTGALTCDVDCRKHLLPTCFRGFDQVWVANVDFYKLVKQVEDQQIDILLLKNELNRVRTLLEEQKQGKSS